MSEIIIHHYPPSPVAEKIRTALGIKRLAWRSVEENRLPPRPELFAMTGGYRRIPVMQIGSELYCDTLCILQELERRHPEPPLLTAGHEGLSLALSRWTDGPLFQLAVRIAVASNLDSMPPELVADRARLYLGPTGSFAQEREDLPHVFAQLRPQLGWLDRQLHAGGSYLLGDEPALPDVLAWYLVWFIRTRHPAPDTLFGEWPALQGWIARMEGIGHGRPSDMGPAEALDTALRSEPETRPMADPRDPQGLTPGMQVAVSQVVDSGDAPVHGEILAVSAERISLLREAPECGPVVVHFPRVGFRVTPA